MQEKNQLVVALIDYIRQYTWDKQLETWVKSAGLLGGGGKEPTIISPKQVHASGCSRCAVLCCAVLCCAVMRMTFGLCCARL